jgi:hypothetical protein
MAEATRRNLAVDRGRGRYNRVQGQGAHPVPWHGTGC